MDSIPGGEDTDKVRCLDSCFQHLGTPTGRNRSLLIKTAALEGELYYSFCFLEPTLGGGGLSGQATETQYKDMLGNVWPEHQSKPLELLIRKQSQETGTTGVTQQNLREGQCSHKQCWDNWVPGQR